MRRARGTEEHVPVPAGRYASLTTHVRIALLVIAALVAGSPAAPCASRARQQASPGYAVIYARERHIVKTNADAIDIYWQHLPSGTPRVLYSIPPRYDVLGSAGYLPSPDGRWLFIWYGLGEEGQYRPVATRFLVLSVADHKTMPVAEVKTYRREGERFVFTVAPLWLDRNRLLLETSFGSGVFDVRTRKLTKPLPAWPPRALPESSCRYTSRPTAEAFVREHYADDLECAKRGLAKLGDVLGLKDALTASFEPDTLESMLARPMGVARPEMPPAGGGWRVHPELACSPNHRYLARAAVLPTDTEVQYRDLKGQWHKAREVAVALDYFDRTEGEDMGPGVRNVLPEVFAQEGKPWRPYSLPSLADLRFSPDGRFFSYTAYDILPPHGHPSMRFGTAKVQGRAAYGFATTGVYVHDTWWATANPDKTERASRGYEWLYFIPDAMNAFVVPAGGP